MFIKVFVPNSRGKIEFTVEELEELLSDACEKAIREKCASCSRGYWGGTIPCITYLNDQNGNFSLNEVTCDSHQFSAETSAQGTQSTLSNTINELIGE
jgi:hypothetical protein